MKALETMSVKELEQESYRLTAQRQALRQEALAVQDMLGKRVEEQRISKLIGRDVQLVEVASIASGESVGEPQ